MKFSMPIIMLARILGLSKEVVFYFQTTGVGTTTKELSIFPAVSRKDS